MGLVVGDTDSFEDEIEAGQVAEPSGPIVNHAAIGAVYHPNAAPERKKVSKAAIGADDEAEKEASPLTPTPTQ